MLATGRVEPIRCSQGFTLIEMLVVLAVSGLVSTLAFPAVERALDQQRFRGGVTAVLAGLSATRADAVRSGKTVRFDVDPARGEFAVTGRTRDTLAEGIAITAAARPILFFKDGSSTGGALSITNAKRAVRISVDSATGKITVRS
jgi:general secretion pathway protein H